MPFIDYRSVRALLGALAAYLIWSAVAPPFGALGPGLLVRTALAVVAALLLGVALPRPLRSAAPSATDSSGGADRQPAPGVRRWRSSAVQQPILMQRDAMRRGSGDASAHRGDPHNVLVLCDGTPAGDNACRLAERYSAQHGATVHAFALLPIMALDRAGHAGGIGPVESFLDRVEAQLRRTASSPAMWPLTLVVSDLQGELQHACASFGIDTIVIPATLCVGPAGVLSATSAVISTASRTCSGNPPVLCVVGAEEGDSFTSPTPASRRLDARSLARLASGDPTRSLT